MLLLLQLVLWLLVVDECLKGAPVSGIGDSDLDFMIYVVWTNDGIS